MPYLGKGLLPCLRQKGLPYRGKVGFCHIEAKGFAISGQGVLPCRGKGVVPCRGKGFAKSWQKGFANSGQGVFAKSGQGGFCQIWAKRWTFGVVVCNYAQLLRAGVGICLPTDCVRVCAKPITCHTLSSQVHSRMIMSMSE